MLKFESNVIIIFSYFDEVLGPQILELYPYQHSNYISNIANLLSILIDVASVQHAENWKFLYGDDLFASQNIKLTILNEEARGGLSDLMISVVLVPPHPQHMAAMAHDWNNVFQLQMLINDQIYFDKNIPLFRDEEKMRSILKSAHEEIRERMQFFVDLLEPGVHKIYGTESVDSFEI